MKEEIIWKLIYWDIQMLRDGWFLSPVYKVNLQYGTYRDSRPETKWKQEKFKTLKLALDYVESERMKL